MVVSLEQRQLVSAMHKNGHSIHEISIALSPLLSRATIYRILHKVKVNSSLQPAFSTGRRRSSRTAKVVEAVRSRMRRNPLRNLTKTAASMGLSRRTLSRVIHDDLHLRGYKTRPREALNARQMLMRVEKSKKLQRLVGPRNLAKVLFTDEKIFTLDESGNHPQVKFYTKQGHSNTRTPVPSQNKSSHSPGVMVRGGVSKLGRSPLVFVEPGVKVNAAYYQESILSKLKDWCDASDGGTSRIILQQDWAPAHRAKTTKQWLRTNTIDFWDESVYPSASPDLNPMDFSIWGWMLQRLRNQNIPTVELLKLKLQEIWESLEQTSIDQAIDQLPGRLEALIHAKGARFE
jgi:inhibitor of nuclear factor kappa-B kinase subunit alpha